MRLLFYFASSILSLTSITADRAQWIVKYNNNDKRFELNHDALSRLSRLLKPVKVISAVGEARVGKSTTLNFVHNILQGDMTQRVSIEEVFETGDSLNPVTRGIWMSVLEKPKENESIVLLDVEGTNLGNDAVTSHLSVFTCLMSSGILVFSPETVKNDILDFLYEVTRLSEHIFKGVDNNHNFGHLHVVIREALRMPAGMTLEESVRNSIVQPSGEDNTTDSKRKAIAKYFHKDSITVSEIPLMPDRVLLKKIEVKNNVKYWDAISSLAHLVKNNFPPKTTLRGNMVDGNALVQTAKTLSEMMNKNSWMDFGDTYRMVEKYLCDKSFQNVVEPALKINTADELETKKETVLKDFRNGCALQDEVNKAEELISTLLFSMREMEKKDKLAKAAEEDRRREEQRRINAEEEMEIAKNQQKEAERKAQEAEENRRKADESKRHAESIIERLGEKSSWTSDVIKGIILGGAIAGPIGAFFSDARLKDEIITMYPSKYKNLGIREVKWTWNKDAEMFGLQGEGHGVIAQEVEKLYPWAVVTGSDGYKRVLYKLLDHVTQSVNCNHTLVFNGTYGDQEPSKKYNSTFMN